MIDGFQRHVNLSRVNLNLQVRELHSLYLHVYNFVDLFQKKILFANGLIEYE